MPSLAESRIRVDCALPMKITERDDLDSGLLEKARKRSSCISLQASRQNQSRFGSGRRTDPGELRLENCGQQLLSFRLAEKDGENGGAVDDQTPLRRYPRICSRSFLVTRRPNSFGGTVGQISLSRKSRACAIRRPLDARVPTRSLRSSNARRMTTVLDSPVIFANSSANRSTSSFLMFMAVENSSSFVLQDSATQLTGPLPAITLAGR